MSEYQYYEFQAIDRPLSKKEMQEIAGLSRRVDLTPYQAIFVYNYGDFPAANQWEMVESVVPVGELIYEEFLNLAAQGEVIHNDDTDVQILSVEQALKKGEINATRKSRRSFSVNSKEAGSVTVPYR